MSGVDHLFGYFSHWEQGNSYLYTGSFLLYTCNAGVILCFVILTSLHVVESLMRQDILVRPHRRPRVPQLPPALGERGVAAQVSFERRIFIPGLMFKGKGLKPGAFQIWVRGSQRAPPHRGTGVQQPRVALRQDVSRGIGGTSCICLNPKP
jgi:hypothetical protein